jgi:hypothetical protein
MTLWNREIVSASPSIQERAAAIGRRTFYSNPFWSDPVKPITDNQVLWAAQVEEDSNANASAGYGQIVQWHQNQEMIRLQQEALDQQRKMLANQERMIQQQQETNHRMWVAEHDRRNRNY